MPVWIFCTATCIAAGQPPVKLDIQAEWDVLRVGEQVPIRIRLLDTANQPAKAPKRFEVQLQTRLQSGEIHPLQTVVLEPGESTKELAIKPPGTGMVYIWAKHPELLPGGAYLAVRSPVPAGHGVSSPIGQGTPTLPSPQRQVPNAPQAAAQAPAPQRPPVASVLPRVALRYSPDRRFLADGKDTATIQAFLVSEFTGSEIRLNLFDSSGTMKPIPLTIPQGQGSGSAAVTFNQPGTVRVEFMSSEPLADVDGDRSLRIPFMPPITHAALEASPPTFSLVDKADLIVTLRDDQGRPVASDATRHVTFAIEAGHGELTQTELDIGAGQFEVRTTFRPAWLGRVRISAATPNLLTVSVPLQTFMPLGLLLSSIAGGLAGGYLSYLKRKRSGLQRLAVGALAGFVFYWACLYIGLAAIGHAAVVNPLSAFALSTFGGWMQIDVFTFWKSRLKPSA